MEINSLSLSLTAEEIGQAVLKAAHSGASVIILPPHREPSASPLIVVEGDPVEGVKKWQALVADMESRLFWQDANADTNETHCAVAPTVKNAPRRDGYTGDLSDTAHLAESTLRHLLAFYADLNVTADRITDDTEREPHDQAVSDASDAILAYVNALINHNA